MVYLVDLQVERSDGLERIGEDADDFQSGSLQVRDHVEQFGNRLGVGYFLVARPQQGQADAFGVRVVNQPEVVAQFAVARLKGCRGEIPLIGEADHFEGHQPREAGIALYREFDDIVGNPVHGRIRKVVHIESQCFVQPAPGSPGHRHESVLVCRQDQHVGVYVEDVAGIEFDQQVVVAKADRLQVKQRCCHGVAGLGC